MKSNLALILSSLALGTIYGHPVLSDRQDPFAAWAPAGPDDVRAPCPMLNTLANHGFLNHDGRNITLEQVQEAFSTYLNIAPSLAQILYNDALTTKPADAAVLDLDDLSTHNILEHDGSLSRQDAYFGDNHDFDQTIFDQTLSFFPSDTITLQQAADARLARMYTSNATNPTFSISQTGTTFSFGETAAYLFVFNIGGALSGIANRTFVEYFFQNERLPTSLGWTTPSPQVGTMELLNGISQVEAATGGSDPVPPSSSRRRSLHGALGRL